MHRKLIVGNWKMNLNRAESVKLAEQLARSNVTRADLAVCPPFVYLDCVSRVLDGSAVAVGAQDVYHEGNGAFTGEISAEMLADLGCRYVIVGHSERRQLLGESDQTVNRKALTALHRQLIPIVCVGETLQEREAGLMLAVIERQFRGSLAEFESSDMERIVLAYEPVWAIGTGKVASPAQAQEVHAALRKLIRTSYNEATARACRILYGGSVKGANAAELLSCQDIDGALVGGASLSAEGFLAIANAA